MIHKRQTKNRTPQCSHNLLRLKPDLDRLSQRCLVYESFTNCNFSTVPRVFYREVLAKVYMKFPGNPLVQKAVYTKKTSKGVTHKDLGLQKINQWRFLYVASKETKVNRTIILKNLSITKRLEAQYLKFKNISSIIKQVVNEQFQNNQLQITYQLRSLIISDHQLQQDHQQLQIPTA